MSLWFYLGIGLVAGLMPSRWFWGRGIQFLDGAQLRSRLVLAPVDSRRRRRWWKSAVLWVDPLRGVVAGWALTRGVEQGGENLDQIIYNLVHYGAFVALAGFVIFQSVGRLKEDEVIAPLLFLGGLLAGFSGWVLGICAFAVGILSLFALQSAGAALLTMAAIMAVGGWFLIGGKDVWLMGIGLCGLPVTLAFFLRHRLVLAIRG